MSPKHSTLTHSQAKSSRGFVLLTVVCIAWSLGCSVYDASLLAHGAPLSNGGNDSVGGTESGGALSDPDAGSAANASASGTGGSDLGLGGDSGQSQAGDSSGGTTGDPGGAGMVAGMSAVGGTGGAVSGGAGGSGGSAGTPAHELASGKKVTASTAQTGNEAAKGNDGDAATRWCATDGTFPQWWRVDLGASHKLSQVSIRFEHPERKYFYLVETSPDDAVYTQQITANGTGTAQTVDLPPNVSARYVRVTITDAQPTAVNGNGTWASFWELSLTGF